jgi:uncharacterized membrane protein YfcA
MARMRRFLEVVEPWFWALAAGVVILYLFGWMLGAFSPDELLGWTIVAAVLALLLGWHAHKVRTAVDKRDPELMRSLNEAREKRGF